MSQYANVKQRNLPPFRFDSVGSFLRSEALKQAREQFNQGTLTQAQLTQVENDEITKLVAKQKEVGLRAVTDGEFRRSYWHLDFFWGFQGVKHVVLDQGYQFHGEETRADSAILTGKLGLDGHPFLEHYRFLKSLVGEDTVAKQCIPAPAQFYAELVRGDNEKLVDTYYPDREELYKDIAHVYRQAILAFYELGCRNLQLDDCTWGMVCDENFWKLMAGEGYDLQSLMELYLRLNNDALTDLPKDLVVTTHVCRGNYHSTWAASGGYDTAAPVLFARENVDAFFLEFDTDRAGGFAPLSYVPAHKQVVLGVFSSKTGQLEDKEAILSRIKDAIEFVSIDNICLSPQCGFASTEEGNILTEEQQWAKLRFIKDIADELWK
ncbi:5-methyltetrahydropteroyltriglutamate--homocysteine S-methyltransferase [Oscillospiraceae bacterium MB08-C2-2]|nr:5-methyltetrahydropteroyltriglutamate--homocysteine S-methyltransferase [Oscillospiraceae bacterium MB08-C2-2]